MLGPLKQASYGWTASKHDMLGPGKDVVDEAQGLLHRHCVLVASLLGRETVAHHRRIRSPRSPRRRCPAPVTQTSYTRCVEAGIRSEHGVDVCEYVLLEPAALVWEREGGREGGRGDGRERREGREGRKGEAASHELVAGKRTIQGTKRNQLIHRKET
jgi:hypothetical protein